jgi:glycosyltransferase involved in cell wall biosynthesis
MWMPRRLSIVIPAYNEESRILPTLGKIHRFLETEKIEAEILVVNDGSTDRTAEVVETQIASLRPIADLQVLHNPGNRGKGYSVRHGMLKAEGERVLFTDSDLSSPIEEYRKLAAPLDRGEASIAIGSRALKDSQVQTHQSLWREYSGRTFNVVVRAVARLPFRDTQCGFKLFSREAARAVFPLQPLDGFGFDVEILYIARKLGYCAAEIPVVWRDVAASRVRLSSGARAFLDILRVRIQDLKGVYNGGKNSEDK